MNGTSRESGSRMGSLLGGGWTVLALAGLAVVYLCGEGCEVEVGPEEGCRDLIGAACQAASCKEGSMTEGCIEYCLCVAHWCGPDGDPAACDDHCSAHPTDVSCGGWCEAHPETDCARQRCEEALGGACEVFCPGNLHDPACVTWCGTFHEECVPLYCEAEHDVGCHDYCAGHLDADVCQPWCDLHSGGACAACWEFGDALRWFEVDRLPTAASCTRPTDVGKDACLRLAEFPRISQSDRPAGSREPDCNDLVTCAHAICTNRQAMCQQRHSTDSCYEPAECLGANACKRAVEDGPDSALSVCRRTADDGTGFAWRSRAEWLDVDCGWRPDQPALGKGVDTGDVLFVD